MIAQKTQRLVIQGAAHVQSKKPNSASSSASSSATTTVPTTSTRRTSSPAKQNQPPVNSSFDDLVDAGLPDSSPRPGRARIGGNVAIVQPARRRDGVQTHIPGRHPGSARIGFYERDPTTLEGAGDTDDGSEISEPDVPTTARVSLNPSVGKANGKRVGVRISSKSDDDDDDDDTDFEQQLKPLSVRRKGSIAPIRIQNSNFNQSTPTGNGGGYVEDTKGSASPTPSATSISSLIRDKLGRVPIPGMFRNKKSKEYRLQAFVIILFLTIILLVGSIYVIHKEKELQKSYFDRIRFSSKDRRIRVTNIQDRLVLSGVLGVNLNSRDKAWPCLVEDQRVNETCLEWMGKGRLYLNTRAPPPRGGLVGMTQATKNNILCYGIYWEGLSTDFTLKDCYDMGENMLRGGYFYGGGEMEHDNWPLNKTEVQWSPFLSGRKVGGNGGGVFQWGHSMRRYFVNSEGAAIKITDDSPLYMSINHPERKKICFGGGTDAFNFPVSVSRLPFLNYTICTAENAYEISKRLGDKSIYAFKLRHDDVQMTYSVAESPIYKISSELLHQGNQSDIALLNYTNKIVSSKLPTNGYILLDETWQETIGDLEADPDRFPNLGETLNITKRRGFRIALTVQPFFSTQSKNYVEGLRKGIWVKERARDSSFGHLPSAQDHSPALTEYKKWNSVAVLDVTQSEARDWIQEKVKSMAEKYGIEALYADMGSSYDLPQYYSHSEPLHSADHSKDLFIQTLRSIPYLSTLGVSTAVKLPKPPTFVSLSPTETSWKGLQSVIPNMLSLGLAGFPFLNPGSVGGDYFPDKTIELANEDDQTLSLTSSNETSSEPTATPDDTDSNSTSVINDTVLPPLANLSAFPLPDRELYIRWLQLSHFLPVVQYSFLPNDYDDEVVKIAQLLEAERRQKIFSFLRKAMNDALTTGLPIIRPLWMMDPLDRNCLFISDEFAIGEDILVAPILKPNSTERDIYLPKGIWKDELGESQTKGDRWLHNYKVKLDQIPYFVKLPDSGPY